MKKLFFFRSSTDKQVCAENTPNSSLGNQRKTRDGHSSESLRTSLFKSQNNDSENQGLDPNACLRRSRSLSSAAFMSKATEQKKLSSLNDRSSSPSSSSGTVNANKQHIHPSRSCTLTPERHVKVNGSTIVPCEKDYVGRKPPFSRSSRRYQDYSDSSSLSSSNVSNEVLDLYIDGEQEYERSSPMSKSSLKNRAQHGGGKNPPRVHCTAPSSPTCSRKGNPRPHPSRGARGLEPYPSSRGWIENGIGLESPKELAKHVVEKLCQTRSRKSSRDLDSDVPITIEDVYSGSLSKNATLESDTTFLQGFAPKDHASTNGSLASCGVESEDDVDIELKSKLEETKDQILFLSEELELESFLDDVEFNVPALVQRIKELSEEKISLALSLSASLESRLTDRLSMKKQLRLLSLELESRTQKFESENTDIQLAMENELDKRSSDWSLKVEILQAEELRLRERIRELAEQNVALQREVSSLSQIEFNSNNMEKQVNDLSAMLEASQVENQDLRQGISALQDKYKGADEDRVCMQQTYREKEEECKDLRACVTRLLRTCNDQEKTIDGLRVELTESVQRKHPMDNSERRAQKLQLELIRLTGVEQGLRREIESYKSEVDSLRNENVNLLNRFTAGRDQGGLISFKLDEELHGRLGLLQNQGLSLLNESTEICSKLLESLKRISRSVGKESTGVNRILDAQFIMESDMKVHGFRRGCESLLRSLKNMSTLLREKSDQSFSNSLSDSMDDNASNLQSGSNLQDSTRSELKAELLLTSLFREKLYTISQEVEQLQAEVATAARGNDILRHEVQNAQDSLSAATHRMKEFELQMIKKDEKIHQLQNDLQENTKELTIMRGILPKVTQERDMMWEEVKQHTEKNMLWNSEVNLLKKKIEALDEELLLKEGQITILRDTLGSKSFDLLASPDRTHEFLLE